MTNRGKMMSVFTDALSSVLPGNLVRDTLKYEAGVLTIEGEEYRLGDYRGVGHDRPTDLVKGRRRTKDDGVVAAVRASGLHGSVVA
jgi:hypothetical protein